MPDVYYPKLLVTRSFVPGVLKRVGVRYFGLGLRLVLVLGLCISVRVYLGVGLGLKLRLSLGSVLEMPGVRYETPGYESQGTKCVETLRSRSWKSEHVPANRK